MLHQALEQLKRDIAFRSTYDNFIGGKWVPPVEGRYFDNLSPVTGKPLCEVARSTPPTSSWRSTPRTPPRTPGARPRPPSASRILNKIADRMEANLELLALVETLDNGKPIRETTAADLPLAVDHFRYFAGCVRAQEGALSRDRPRHRRLSLPRAARRRRPDHPVELPAADGGVEARAGARRRQLRGAQAGRADAARASWCWPS